MNKINLVSFFSGLVFALGLGISGMMDASKVQGFLDLSGKWDPSLGLVMGGGVAVTFLTFPLIFKRKHPILEEKFSLPTNKKLDKPLIIGAMLFGMGWGIGGLCPGPALANLGTFRPEIVVFVLAMLTGFWIQKNFLTPKPKVVIAQEVTVEKKDDPCLVD